MNPPSEIILELLRVNSLVTQSGDWTGYYGHLPDGPDMAVCVFDTQGLQDGRIMRTGERIDHPGIQITVRGKTHGEVYSRAYEIATLLDAQCKTLIEVDSDAVYILHNVKRLGTLNYLGQEAVGNKRRHVITINAVLTIKAYESETEDYVSVQFISGNGQPATPPALYNVGAVYYDTISYFYWDWDVRAQAWKARPKVYRALLTQYGTAAPEATVLENSLDGVPVWSRSGFGDYRVTLVNSFLSGLTFCKAGVSSGNNPSIATVAGDNNQIRVYSYSDYGDIQSGTAIGAADEMLNETPIEILVYPPPED